MPRRHGSDVAAPGPLSVAAGGVASLAISVAVFTRYSIDDTLKRDEAIYVYAGQQLTHGVAPYASIFDPKPPLATFITGASAAIGKVFGVNDVHAMRLVFFVISCLTVLAVYQLGLRLWRSTIGALVGATVFACFRGFAMDALAGPDAKTPGLLFGVLSMSLAVRRQWFWSAVLGSLAFLVWQPLAIYVAVALLAAVLAPDGPARVDSADRSERVRTAGRIEAMTRRAAVTRVVIGAAIPLSLATLYFVVTGTLGKLIESVFAFPFTGVKRGKETLVGRLHHILDVIRVGYGQSGWLFLLGVALLAVLLLVHLAAGQGDLRARLVSPLVVVVTTSLAGLAAFSATDFQGIPDLYPLLVYAALGLGGTAAGVIAVLRQPALRTAATAGALIAVLALTGLSMRWFSHDKAADGGLVAQRSDACDLQRLAGGGVVYSLGDPAPLVLTERRNPSRYVYLNSGVADWQVARTPGGYAGWQGRILATTPEVILLNNWHAAIARRTDAWLATVHKPGYIGRLRAFLSPTAVARARSDGITISPTRALRTSVTPGRHC